VELSAERDQDLHRDHNYYWDFVVSRPGLEPGTL
jgi:hypothetical protein